MKMTFHLSLMIVLAAACRTGAAQGEFDPAERAAVVAPFIDQTTVAVVHADLSRVSVDPLVDRIAQISPETRADQEEIRQRMRGLLAAFDQVGCNEVYVVFSLADIPMQPPLVIVTAPEGADIRPILELGQTSLRGESRGVVTKRIGDIVCFGSPARIAKLDHLKPDPRPELQKAFEAAGDTAVQALLLPPTYTRRLVEEMMPTLPDTLGGGSSQVLTRGVLWAALGVNLPPELSVRAVLQSEDDRAAEAFREGMVRILKALSSQQDTARSMPELNAVTSLLTAQVQADQLVLALSDADGSIASLLAALQPAFERATRSARRARSANHLKQLALAMHNYHDRHKSFPTPANYGADGKPLLSWRVHVLPYLGQNDLYQQFHLDEPWDSEHNAKLIPRMPEVFRSAVSKLGERGRASYLLPVGEETVFPGGKGISFKEITDGTVNTLMIVEVDDSLAPVWTKPEDLPIDLEYPLKGLGGLYGGEGFNAAICDGSVRFFRSSIDPEVFRKLLTRAGGEVVSWSDL